MDSTPQSGKRTRFLNRMPGMGLGVPSLFLILCIFLPGCSKKIDCPPPLVTTKTEYVFPPEQYFQPTREPRIDSYPRTLAGYVAYAKDTVKALKEANKDKAKSLEYIERKRTAEAGSEM